MAADLEGDRPEPAVATGIHVSTIPSLDPLAAESRAPCGSAR
jgi:hypothetical protein